MSAVLRDDEFKFSSKQMFETDALPGTSENSFWRAKATVVCWLLKRKTSQSKLWLNDGTISHSLCWNWNFFAIPPVEQAAFIHSQLTPILRYVKKVTLAPFWVGYIKSTVVSELRAFTVWSCPPFSWNTEIVSNGFELLWSKLCAHLYPLSAGWTEVK